MPNGDKYLLFYMKLLCEGVGNNGNLRLNEKVPYNEIMLSVITNTDTDTVKNAMIILKNESLLSVDCDGTIIITKHIDKRIRTTKEYCYWRKSVFERDNYACQSCGEKGVELNAHHIKKWSDYIELRTDVKNGITLCKKCHKELHKKERAL